jgi:hypothetical protein
MLYYMKISFITSVKLKGSYVLLQYKLKMYAEQITVNCKKLGIDYEIILCEDIDETNEKFLKDVYDENYLLENNIKLLETKHDYYNPFNYCMLESPNKNKGIYNSTGDYLCVTSGDIFMNDRFFIYLKELNKNIFYRFYSYEVEELDIEWSDVNLEYMKKYCEENTIRSFNEQYLKADRLTLNNIAYKSGDIMLMDRDNWLKIKGFSETLGNFHHSDFVVCGVVCNNKIKVGIVDNGVKIYTLKHERTMKNNIKVEKNKSVDSNEWDIACKYVYSGNLTCN